MFISKTMLEILGVYSTQEKAKEAYDIFFSSMLGSDNIKGITIVKSLMDPTMIGVKDE